MLNSKSPASTTANSSTNVELTKSSPTCTKPLVGGCGSLKPILFKTEMVQAILEGRKTQTRRIVKPQPKQSDVSKNAGTGYYTIFKEDDCFQITPKYKIGDVLWVKETFSTGFIDEQSYHYKADDANPNEFKKMGWKWKPSLFMPLNACRLFLKVTNVRIERLQDISNQDAINEGIEPKKIERVTFFKDYGYNNFIHRNPKSSFATLWFEVNGKESWEQNPFVWVIEFERCQK